MMNRWWSGPSIDQAWVTPSPKCRPSQTKPQKYYCFPAPAYYFDIYVYIYIDYSIHGYCDKFSNPSILDLNCWTCWCKKPWNVVSKCMSSSDIQLSDPGCIYCFFSVPAPCRKLRLYRFAHPQLYKCLRQHAAGRAIAQPGKWKCWKTIQHSQQRGKPNSEPSTMVQYSLPLGWFEADIQLSRY